MKTSAFQYNTLSLKFTHAFWLSLIFKEIITDLSLRRDSMLSTLESDDDSPESALSRWTAEGMGSSSSSITSPSGCKGTKAKTITYTSLMQRIKQTKARTNHTKTIKFMTRPRAESILIFGRKAMNAFLKEKHLPATMPVLPGQ